MALPTTEERQTLQALQILQQEGFTKPGMPMDQQLQILDAVNKMRDAAVHTYLVTTPTGTEIVNATAGSVKDATTQTQQYHDAIKGEGIPYGKIAQDATFFSAELLHRNNGWTWANAKKLFTPNVDGVYNSLGKVPPTTNIPTGSFTKYVTVATERQMVREVETGLVKTAEKEVVKQVEKTAGKGMLSFLKMGGKYMPGWINVGISAMDDIGSGYQAAKQGDQRGLYQSVCGVVGTAGGVWAGAASGAAIGTMIPIPVVGTIIGAGLGALFGWLGGKAARGIAHEVVGDSDEQKAKKQIAQMRAPVQLDLSTQQLLAANPQMLGSLQPSAVNNPYLANNFNPRTNGV